LDDKIKKRILFLLIFFTLYLPFLEANGWDLINKQAWDFPSFYYAAEAALDLGLSPYNQENWLIAESLYDGTLFAFLYMPSAILLFRLFNILEFESAKLLMLGVNHLMIFVLIWLLFRKLLKVSYLDILFVFGVVYIFSFSPLMATLRLGQVNIIVLNFLLIAWLGLKRGWHPATVGIPLAFATILKLSPAIFFVYLMIKKRYKAMFWGAGILLVAFGLSISILPKNIWADWITNVLSPGFGEVIRGLNPAATSNQGINGFSARFFLGLDKRIEPMFDNPVVGKFFAYLVAIGITLPTLFLAFKKNAKAKGADPWDLDFSLFLTVMYLVSPLAWDHHLVFLLPPIFVAIASLIDDWNELERKWIWAALLLTSVVAISYPFPYNLPVFRRDLRPLLISIKFYSVTVIWLFLWKSNWSVKQIFHS
jgi:hypothetical protein